MTKYNKNDIYGWLLQQSPHIRHVGKTHHSGTWVEPERILFDHQLVIIEEGLFVVNVENKKVQLERGDFIIIPPDLVHRSQMRTKSGIRRWVHFDWCFSEKRSGLMIVNHYPLLSEKKLNVNNLVLQVENVLDGSCHQLKGVLLSHDKLYRRWLDQLTLATRAEMFNLLESLFQAKLNHSKNNEVMDRLEKIRERLRAESLKPINCTKYINTLLKSSGQSYEHLCRLFKKFYGLSPHQYVTKLRIERSKQLLQEGCKVKDVALQVGFDSNAYFSKIFKASVGITPGRYAENIED